MKYAQLYLALIALIHPTNAQWKQTQGPAGGGVTALVCVKMPGAPARSVMLGGSSNIFRSTDGGNSWMCLPNPVRLGGILSFACIPTTDGSSDSLVLAGGNGALLRSTDYGATWDVLSSTISYAYSLVRIRRREPTGHDLLFASAPSYGLYRSSDGGANWIKLPTDFKYPSGALAADTNASPNGTVRLFAGAYDSARVYSSTDFGDHWTPAGTGLPSADIRSLLVIDSAVYAGTATGVYVSTDMGSSWIEDGDGMPTTSVHALACYGAAGSKQLFAATDDRVFVKAPGAAPWAALAQDQPTPRSFALCATGEELWVGSDYGVYRSTLLWSSWASANNGITSLQATDIAIFEDVSEDPHARMFASTFGGGVFMSLDHGENWTPVNGGLADSNVNCLLRDDTSLYAGTSGGGVFRFRQSAGDWIAAHAGLPYTDVVSIVRSGNTLLAAALGHGVFVSTNDGGDWSPSNDGLDNLDVSTLATDGFTVYAGTAGGGVFGSTDRGGHWARMNSGLGDLVITRLYISGSRLYAGTHGGVYLSANRGSSWQAASTGLSEPGVMSLFACDSRLFAGTTNGKLFTSTDGGGLWTLHEDFDSPADILAVTSSAGPMPGQTEVWVCGFGNGIARSRNEWTELTPSNSGLVNTPVRDIVAKAGASSGPSMLFAASSGVHRSTDGGWTWTPARSGLTGLWVTCLAATPVERNGAPEMLLAGTTNGGVCRSSDDGSSWVPVHADVPNNGGYGVTGILFMPRPLQGDGMDILFSVPSAGIFLSTDAGESWTSVNNGLPVSPAGRLQGPSALARLDTMVFAATEVGVYRSSDRGRNWAPSSTGILARSTGGSFCVVGSSLFFEMGTVVYRTSDYGATWHNVNVPLTTPTGAEAVDAMAAVGGALFIGTVHGWILMSPDLGAHWSRVDDGAFSTVNIRTLFADVSSPSAGERYLLAGTWMFAGTFGAGIWRRPLAEVLPSLTIGPDSISFGGVEIGGQRLDSVRVNNNSTSPLSINAAVQGSGAFGVSPPAVTVPAGGTSAFVVSYAPGSEGHDHADLVFTSTALTTPDTVRVDGFGIPTDVVTITSVTPGSGAVGSAVTISGAHFGPSPDSNIVRFGGVKAAITTATSSRIVAAVPAGAMYAPVTVTTRGRTASGIRPFIVTFPSCGRIDSTSFSQAVQLPPGGMIPVRHAVGDLDGDGKLDIVAWDPDSTAVAVYRNASRPGELLATSFAAPVRFTMGTKPWSAVLDDMDGDGKLDIVAAPGPSVLRNTSMPGSIAENSFAPPVTFTGGGSGVKPADVDGDGRPDLVSPSSDGTVAIRMNLSSPGNIGPESFGPAVLFAAGGSLDELTVADLDGDGKPDIASAIGQYTGVFVLRNTCMRGAITPASFAPAVRFGAGSYIWDVVATDFDGDGKLDLMTVLRFLDGVSALRNTGVVGEITATSFSSPYWYLASPWPRRMIPGDLDGDGKPDLIVTLTAVYPLSVQLLHNAFLPGTLTDSSFTSSRLLIGTSGQYYDLAVNDLDGDGRPDIAYGVSTAATGSSLALMRNRLGDTYVIRASADTNGQIIPGGDVPVLHGTTMAFTFVPRPGWGVDSVVVDGRRDDSLSSYTFHNVTSSHSLRVFFGPSTGVRGPGSTLPTVFALEQNYPNPFNPTTVVEWQVAAVSHVRIVVYDLLGREVAVLMNEKKEAGRYEVKWNAGGCASGVYICRMTAGDFVDSKKWLLVR